MPDSCHPHFQFLMQPLAVLNGRMIPFAELTIPAYDAGFVLGATVSEQLRTFGGKIFKLDEHLARLRRGLEITAIDAGCTDADFAAWANELVAVNHKLVDPADDLGLSIFVTPGPYGTLAPADVPRRPTIGMSTYPLPFHLWAEKYERGDHLVTSSVRQVSAESWPRELKCRSRMHYYLAEQDVRRRVPGARPLLLDENGYVNETPTANIVGYRSGLRRDVESFLAPLYDEILPGVSQAALFELESHRVAITGRRTPDDFVAEVDEVFITSTPFCLLPIVQINDAPILNGRPGPHYRRFLELWSSQVGIDIAEQSRHFANRGS